MNFLRKTLSKELDTFRALSIHARKLTLSILFYQISDIGIYTFAYAFLFEQTHDFTAVAIFNLGFYITLPFAYMLTAYLLKHFTLKQISVAGLAGQGLTLCSLFLIPHLTFPIIFLIGLIVGIPMGLYWACRLFLFTSEVPNTQRDYVSGITNSTNSVVRVVIPVIFGWFIATSPTIGFSKLSAYQLIALIGTISYILSGIALHSKPTIHPKITKLFLHKPSRKWNWFRLFVLFGSVQFTISLAIPESLTLGYLGNEAVLGTLIAAFNILSGLSLYVFGRLTNNSNRTRVLVMSLVPLLIGSILMLTSFSRPVILLYLLASSIFDTFFWFVYFPLLSDQVETDSENDIEGSYPYIVDHEIFINTGRVITSLVYLFIVAKLRVDSAISLAVFLGAISQIVILFASHKLRHEKVKTPSPAISPDTPSEV